MKNLHFMSLVEFRSLVDPKPHTYDDGNPVHRLHATPDEIARLIGLTNRVHVTTIGDVAFTKDDVGDRPVAIIFPSRP